MDQPFYTGGSPLLFFKLYGKIQVVIVWFIKRVIGIISSFFICFNIMVISSSGPELFLGVRLSIILAVSMLLITSKLKRV